MLSLVKLRATGCPMQAPFLHKKLYARTIPCASWELGQRHSIPHMIPVSASIVLGGISNKGLSYLHPLLDEETRKGILPWHRN